MEDDLRGWARELKGFGVFWNSLPRPKMKLLRMKGLWAVFIGNK